MVEFAGWSMPVQYSSILEEHKAVRETAGIFDISHMGEFAVSGPDAEKKLNAIFTNDLAKLERGQGQYTLMCNERGGVIDDLIIYKLNANRFWLVVNASMIEEDFVWIQKQLGNAELKLENQSDATGALALQGPKAEEILTAFLKPDEVLPKRNEIKSFLWGVVQMYVACTGYTGERGYELFFPAGASEKVLYALLNAGKPLGLKPAGLGARDTLRLEACYPLNGNDLSPERTPLEAGLGIFVALDKEADFPGKAVMARQKVCGPEWKLVAWRMVEKGAPPRAHYPLYAGQNKVGELTSGCLSPTLGYGIGMGYVQSRYSSPGQELDVEVRGNRVKGIITKKPFYRNL